jgi:hypothetical protein
MIKTLMKLGIEGIYFNIIKVIYDKPVVNIILKGKKTQSIFSKVRNKKSISTLIQHNFVIPSQSTKTGRRDKRSTNWKDSSQSILFANDMILYLKDLKNSTKKLLDTTNSFSKVAGYKVKVQKSVVFLSINNED